MREGVEEAVADALQRLRGGAGPQPAPRLTDTGHVGPGLLQHRIGEGEWLAVVPRDEIHHGGLRAGGLDHLVQAGDVSDRLGHLLAGELDHPVVHPDRGELAAARRACLGGLVLVVGEDEVRPSAVDVEADAEDLLRHRRALDVPAGAPVAPR